MIFSDVVLFVALQFEGPRIWVETYRKTKHNTCVISELRTMALRRSLDSLPMDCCYSKDAPVLDFGGWDGLRIE